jgi:hypothetical protein
MTKASGLIFTALLFLCSCGQKENIIPSFELKESTEQSYRFSMSRSDAVDSPTLEFSDVGPIGGVVQNLADAIGDIMLNEDEMTVPLDPVVFYLPEIKDADLAVIERVSLERVLVRMKSSAEQTSLNFLKRIEVYLDYGFSSPGDPSPLSQDNEGDGFSPDDPLSREVVLGGEIPRDAELILSYERSRESLLCLGTCLNMTTFPIDFKEVLDQRYTSYTIHLRLVIDGMPKGSIDLETYFDVRVDADFFK